MGNNFPQTFFKLKTRLGVNKEQGKVSGGVWNERESEKRELPPPHPGRRAKRRTD
jgi:hypothetical protein